MKIGFFEFLLVLCIAALTVGPTVALWVDRWLRRARRTQAVNARRRAAAEAARAAEREDLMRRFQMASRVVAVLALAVVVYGLVLRPIDTAPQVYTAPADPAEQSVTVTAAQSGDSLTLTGYEDPACIRVRDEWIYLSAKVKSRSRRTVSALLRLHADGSGLSELLTVEGEITAFDFDADGSLWFAIVTDEGGALCRADYDGWGAASEQVVTQIDGTALHCPAAVAVAPDGKIYFTDAAAINADGGFEAALRTELLAHTATGWVYVYDPATRTVERVLGGLAGAAGLALSPDGSTLYASDLGTRCVWAVDAASRELTAGGRFCEAFAAALPAYPGALTVDADGTVCVSYRWQRCGWLEDHSGGTLLRGAALRMSDTTQTKLLDSPARSAAFFAADGSLLSAVSAAGRTAFAQASGSRVYLALADGQELVWVRV